MRRSAARSAAAFWSVVALAAVVSAPGGSGARAEVEARFEVAGSNTVGERLMPALIEGFFASQGLATQREPGAGDAEREILRGVFGLEPALEIALERRGSSTAFSALLEGRAALGMSSRRIRETEADALRAAGAPPMRETASEHVIALDGLAVVVAPSNPLGAITLDDLAAVFSGAIADWSELGLPPGPIRLHARDDRSGTFDTFASLVLEPAGTRLSDKAERYVSNERLAAAVAADARAIGFAPLSVVGSVKTVAIALACGIQVRPDAFTVKAEEYPLGRRLYLYTRGAPEPKPAADLVAFAESEAAQPIVSEAGFVDQSIQGQPLTALGDRLINGMRAAADGPSREAMRAFAAATRGATRLSPTFRFQPGGDLLDGKALDDAARLSRWLDRPENAARRVLVAGFSDASGAFERNMSLTRQRAEAVRRAVLVQVGAGFDPSRLVVEGFGPAAPIACDDDPKGAAANRRVEVWVLPDAAQ